MREDFGKIYCIGAGGRDVVKIGYTSIDPKKRLSHLQTGCPDKLEYYGFIYGTLDDEKTLHRQFSQHRIRGEWFRLDGDVFMFMMDAIAQSFPQGQVK